MNKKEKLEIKLKILKKMVESKDNISEVLTKEQAENQEIIDESIKKVHNSLTK